MDGTVTDRREEASEVEERHGWRCLARTNLLEGEIDQALELLTDPRSIYLDPVRIARAAEEARPRAAIGIYQKRVQEFIDARGRGNYAAAASLLLRVRHLYREIDDLAGWRTYIQDLRTAYHGRTALRDELDSAGL